MTAPTRSPRLGYALAASAATMWALNGSLARFLLDDHMPAARLAELRSIITFVALVAGVSLIRPGLLRIRRRDLGRLALFGIVGLAGVQALYFVAIARLQIGVALTIQYVGPMLLLVWLKLVHRRALPRGLWRAAALSLLGCFFVVGAYHPGSLDGVGVLAALGTAITFAIYLFASEQLGHRYQPATTLGWGFGLATVFWLITQPVWSFPLHALSTPRNLVFAAYVAVGGTLLPFACMIAATRHLPAHRAGVVATLEPVLAAVLAWPIHDQVLSPLQLAGGLTVIAAVIWIQSQRPELEGELAPAIDGPRRPSARRAPAPVE
jgi:drug/metabolite transporter (DMT)-like permease